MAQPALDRTRLQPMSPPALTGIEHRIIVGIAEMTVANDPDVILATYSLGSCLGVAIFDPVAKAGGLLRLLLLRNSTVSAKTGEHRRRKALRIERQHFRRWRPGRIETALPLRVLKS